MFLTISKCAPRSETGKSRLGARAPAEPGAGGEQGGHPHITAGAATDFTARGWELLWPQSKRARGGTWPVRTGRGAAMLPAAVWSPWWKPSSSISPEPAPCSPGEGIPRSGLRMGEERRETSRRGNRDPSLSPQRWDKTGSIRPPEQHRAPGTAWQGRSQAASPMTQAEDRAGASAAPPPPGDTTVPALSPHCPCWWLGPRGPGPWPPCQALPPRRFPVLRAGTSKHQGNQGRRADRRCCQTSKTDKPVKQSIHFPPFNFFP